MAGGKFFRPISHTSTHSSTSRRNPPRSPLFIVHRSYLLPQRSPAGRAVVRNRVHDLRAAVTARSVEGPAAAGAEAITRVARNAAAEAARYTPEWKGWDTVLITIDPSWQRWHFVPVGSMREWPSWDSALKPQAIDAWLQLRPAPVTVAVRFKLFPSAARS